MDGILPVNCEAVSYMLEAEIAAPCPDNNCGPRWNSEFGVYEFFTATTDGFIGYIPWGGEYLGDGDWGWSDVSYQSGRAPRTPRNPFGIVGEGGSLDEDLYQFLPHNREHERGGPREPSEPPEPPGVGDNKELFSVKRFVWCLKNLFSVTPEDPDKLADNRYSTWEITRDGGRFWGVTPSGTHYSVVSDTGKYSSKDIIGLTGKPGHFGGYTDPKYPETNFISSDVAKNAPFELLRAVWVHELGNSLSHMTKLYPKAKNAALLKWDGDSGNALEECVYGGKVVQIGKNSVGVTTNPGSR